jgi:hypothetical protein
VADALKWAFLNMTPVGQVIQHWDEIKAGAMAVVEWMSAIPSQIMQIGRDLIDGLINGIRERWQALKNGISNIASGIADTVRGMLGINSPSRVFAEIGGHLMDGLSQGIERTAGLPLAAMRSVATGLAVPIAAGGILLGGVANAAAPAMPMQAVPPFIVERQALNIVAPTLPPLAVGDMPVLRGMVDMPPITVPDLPSLTADLPELSVGDLPTLTVSAPALPPLSAPTAPNPNEATRAPATAQATPPAKLLAPPAAPTIQITVNLNGHATSEAAQDVAAAVRREVERALAESARRDALARRAAMIDGGLA